MSVEKKKKSKNWRKRADPAIKKIKKLYIHEVARYSGLNNSSVARGKFTDYELDGIFKKKAYIDIMSFFDICFHFTYCWEILEEKIFSMILRTVDDKLRLLQNMDSKPW